MCLRSLLLFVADFTRQLQRLVFQADLSRFISGIRMDLILPKQQRKSFLVDQKSHSQKKDKCVKFFFFYRQL